MTLSTFGTSTLTTTGRALHPYTWMKGTAVVTLDEAMRPGRAGDEERESDEDEQDAALMDKPSGMESFAELAALLARDLRVEPGPDDAAEEA